ncbi:MAG: hypothetical protein ABSB53_05120 [Nitrososphaerales archaeon]
MSRFEAACGTVRVSRSVHLSGGNWVKLEADSSYDDAELDSSFETVAAGLDARIRKELAGGVSE